MEIPCARFLHNALIILLVGFLMGLLYESNIKFIVHEICRRPLSALLRDIKLDRRAFPHVPSILCVNLGSNKARIDLIDERFASTYRASVLSCSVSKCRIMITPLLYYPLISKCRQIGRSKDQFLFSLSTAFFLTLPAESTRMIPDYLTRLIGFHDL